MLIYNGLPVCLSSNLILSDDNWWWHLRRGAAASICKYLFVQKAAVLARHRQ